MREVVPASLLVGGSTTATAMVLASVCTWLLLVLNELEELRAANEAAGATVKAQ